MEYVYAALILNESGEEINEDNLTGVLEAASVDVEESRVKALVAALEDVDIDEAVEDAAAVPATTGGGGAAPATGDDEDEAEAEVEAEADDEEEAEAETEEEDDDDDGGGEGLGELFG